MELLRERHASAPGTSPKFDDAFGAVKPKPLVPAVASAPARNAAPPTGGGHYASPIKYRGKPGQQ